MRKKAFFKGLTAGILAGWVVFNIASPIAVAQEVTPTVEPTIEPTVQPTATPTIEVTPTPEVLEASQSATILLIPTPSPTPTVAIMTATNSATVIVEAESGANSGDNISETKDGEILLETGEAVAEAEVTNVINVTLVDSQLTTDTKETGSVDLNEQWKEEEKTNQKLAEVLNEENTALISNEVMAVANTGGNKSSTTGGVNEVNAGAATALANVVNIVNTTLIDSQLMVATIDVWGDETLEIILPNPEDFAGDGLTAQAGISEENTALVNSQVSATANSGGNIQTNSGGENNLTTGEAYAISHNLTFANVISQGLGFYLVFINNPGNWEGTISGLGKSLTYEDGILSTGWPESSRLGQAVMADNEASLTSQVTVSANSGENTSINKQGTNETKTGKATAIANVFNLVNSTLQGSKWFIGQINILGSWNGAIKVARPDMVVSISESSSTLKPGEDVDYTISYANMGEETAKGARLRLMLPKGLVPIDEGGLVWDLGDLSKGFSQFFKFKVRVDPELDLDKGESQPLVATVEVVVSNEETETGNNSASQTLLAYIPEEDRGGIDMRLPVIKLEGKNNVNNFVYPGDTVTFEYEIANTADVPASEAVLRHRLYEGQSLIGELELPLGTLPASGQGVLSFGITIPSGLDQEGSFYTETFVKGLAPAGTEIFSNQVGTKFLVSLPFSLAKVEMENELEEEILGEQTEALPENRGDDLGEVKRIPWPWETFTMFSCAMTAEHFNRKRLERDRNNHETL